MKISEEISDPVAMTIDGVWFPNVRGTVFYKIACLNIYRMLNL